MTRHGFIPKLTPGAASMRGRNQSTFREPAQISIHPVDTRHLGFWRYTRGAGRGNVGDRGSPRLELSV